MAVKFFILKVFVTIILLNIVEGRSSYHSKHTLDHSSDDVTSMRNQSTVSVTETNSISKYLNSSINAVKRVINALPSPKQIFHYGKQALIGVPEEIASDTKRFLCKSRPHYCI